MIQSLLIAFSGVIYLLSLFFSKSIFLSLGSVFFVLLLSIIFELIWANRIRVINYKHFNSIVRLIICTLLVYSLYIIFYLPIEFILSELLLIIPKIDVRIQTTIIIIFVLIFFQVKLEKIINSKRHFFLLFLLFVFAGTVFTFYRKEKSAREFIPKIYSVSPKGAFQSEIVKIKGTGFGELGKKGQIFIGNDEIWVKEWGEREIIIELPVPKKLGKNPLYIVKYDEQVSNIIDFEAKDPNSLKK